MVAGWRVELWRGQWPGRVDLRTTKPAIVVCGVASAIFLGYARRWSA